MPGKTAPREAEGIAGEEMALLKHKEVERLS